MLLPYLLISYLSVAFGQGTPKIEVLPGPKSIEDFEHQYKGCPENSECDQVMGHQMSRWNELISKLKSGMDSRKKIQFIELFRAKYGIPSEFYTFQKSQQGFKPLLFDSPCRQHNPKEGEKVLRGVAFLKSLSSEHGVVWRDQTQIEVPVGELLLPQPVLVYGQETPVVYQLPLNDQPLFIKDKALFVLKEDDGLFFFLKISADGQWKVEEVDMTRLGQWEDKRSSVTCPTEDKKASPVFKDNFCKTIWSEDLKKPVLVKMHQGCST